MSLSSQLTDCPICFDELKDGNSSNILALTCGHITCFECVFKWIEGSIINQNYPLTCPVCRTELQYWEIENMFNQHSFLSSSSKDKSVFHKYDTYLLEKSINTMDNAIWCPKGCGEAIVIGNNYTTRIACPGCKELFCFKCQTLWHPETTCDLYQKWLKENKQGDTKFKQFAMNNLKRCPKCLTWVQKNGGCSHMTCKHCKYEWFWTTGKGYKTGVVEAPIPDEYKTKPVSIEPKPKKSTKKVRSTEKCVARIKSGNRKGQQCTNSALLGDRFCGIHTDWFDATDLQFSQFEFGQSSLPNNEFNIN